MIVNFVSVLFLALFLFKYSECQGNEIKRCDFENGDLCDWKTKYGTWKSAKGDRSNKVEINGPLFPFEKDGDYVKLTRISGSDASILTSPFFEKPPTDVCFTFRYYLFASEDMCSWKPGENNTNNLRWLRDNRGHLESYDSYLPELDHSTSTKNGKYIFTYSENYATGTTSIKSPVHDISFGVHCLSLWYYRPQGNRDELIIYIEDATNATIRKQLWTSALADTDNVEHWQFIQTTVAASNSFRISLEANRKQRSQAATTIAVDDISLQRGECHTITSCDFNDDLCGFIVDASNVTLRHGFGRVTNVEKMNNAMSKYVPPTDSSNSDGLFIYSDFSDIKQQTRNILLSEPLKASKQSCLKFTYYLNGDKNDQKATLLVNVLAIGNSKGSKTMFADSEYSSEWKNKSISINHADSAFRIAFEMSAPVAGSIVAIDNVKYIEGNCDDVLPPKSSELIKELSCDFENGLCSWTS
ncbi:MAM and LDL-receptor class A domain-containing protein 1-like protein, partial [Leptotrombidium deliense]